MTELPSGAVTFLFTDIEGSTQLVKRLRDRYHSLLAEHQRILREAFAEHGGHEIDTQGDAFFVAFASARDAVLAAVDAQRALAQHAWPEGTRVKIRIGVHTGQASPSDGTYTGVAVHRAARISAAGHGGQILVSQTTHNLLEDEEEDIAGAEFLDLGEHQLKDLDRPVRLFQVGAAGLEHEFPPLRTAAPAPAAAPERPYYRRRTILVGALAGVIAAAVAIPIFALGGGGSSGGGAPGGGSNAVGLIESGSAELQGSIDSPGAPTAVAAGRGYVWVASADADAVYALDPDTHTVRDQIALDGPPGGIAVGAGYVWVTNSLAGTVSQIDPESFEVRQNVPVGNGPTGVAVGAGYLWVSNSVDHTVSRVNIRTGDSVAYPAGADPSGIAVGASAIWVASKSTGTVVKLSPAGTQLDEVNVGAGPSAVTFGAGAVWVANSLDGTVSKIGPETGRVVGTVEVGGAPSGLAIAANRVWVSNDLEGTVLWIDRAAKQATPVSVGGRSTSVAAEGADVYVGLRPAGPAHRGGTLKVAAGQVFFTLDPAVAYSGELWQFLSLTNDGLLTYRRAAGQPGYQLVPDLATAMPLVSEDGKTYTFELRPGIRYSTGGVVKASDVRSSIERAYTLKPHRQESIPEFFGAIVGANACDVKRCDLSRGVVTDDAARTVTFHLTASDPIFLHKLALPFGSVLPSSVSRTEAVKRALPATGPYRVAGVDGKRTVRLVRNPAFEEWSTAAQPAGYPDEIVFDFDESEAQRVKSVDQGVADLTSLDPFESLPASVRVRSRLRKHPIAITLFFVLNPTKSPFDDVRARQALNYAVDRNRIVQLAREDAVSTCQVLPPNFPGYRRYCPYTVDPNEEGTWTAPDLPKALQLVDASGTKGEKVTIWFPRSKLPRVGKYVASVLESLGYDVRVKSAFDDENDYFEAMIPASPQLASVGWAPTYPSAENFIRPLFTCGSDGNFGHFCDRRFDRKVGRALEVQSHDPTAANELWAQLDHEITDRAALLPLYNIYGADLISKRVGNYQYNPQYGALLSQMWVR